MNTECNYEVSTDYAALWDTLKDAPVVCFVTSYLPYRQAITMRVLPDPDSKTTASFLDSNPFILDICELAYAPNEHTKFIQACSKLALTFIPHTNKCEQ
jgi:hypothetical protein